MLLCHLFILKFIYLSMFKYNFIVIEFNPSIPIKLLTIWCSGTSGCMGVGRVTMDLFNHIILFLTMDATITF